VTIIAAKGRQATGSSRLVESDADGEFSDLEFESRAGETGETELVVATVTGPGPFATRVDGGSAWVLSGRAASVRAEPPVAGF
jgi:hypothetical protein